MPELPDITVYLEALDRFIVGRHIESIVVRSPFVVRTFDPPIEECHGRLVSGVRRLGKRVVLELEQDLLLVFHLMIAGRFHWKKPGTKPARKVDLAALNFDSGTLMLTEASQKKRASIHVVRGEAGLEEHSRGGVNVLDCTVDEFRTRLESVNRTLKRALTDPMLFDGIGNAYSDEILHEARLSPLQLTRHLDEAESARLWEAACATLVLWTDRLREAVGDRFPEKVTAFHPEMAVHGRFGEPCPVCETKVQRVVYAQREFNYCPGCQTDGRVLKDRSLSRLLKDDWPASVDEL